MSQITVRNVVSRRTQEGLVEILHDEVLIGQLEPENARQLAGQIHECAAVAETEAMLVAFLMRRVKLTLEQAVQVLADFRTQREQVKT
jgi:hypothetical protein